eukprot:2683506-Amphidinium_carterae.1
MAVFLGQHWRTKSQLNALHCHRSHIGRQVLPSQQVHRSFLRGGVSACCLGKEYTALVHSMGLGPSGSWAAAGRHNDFRTESILA